MTTAPRTTTHHTARAARLHAAHLEAVASNRATMEAAVVRAEQLIALLRLQVADSQDQLNAGNGGWGPVGDVQHVVAALDRLTVGPFYTPDCPEELSAKAAREEALQTRVLKWRPGLR